jgi:hypothetical protein
MTKEWNHGPRGLVMLPCSHCEGETLHRCKDGKTICNHCQRPYVPQVLTYTPPKALTVNLKRPLHMADVRPRKKRTKGPPPPRVGGHALPKGKLPRGRFKAPAWAKS